MSNCPKCNEKLSPFYLKQNCPKCGTNLVYYDLENRLQADHEKAMKEQAAVERVLNNIKTSAFGGKEQITRFILMFSPLAWMCLTMFKTADFTKITLINVIVGIINGSMPFDKILSDNSYLFPVLTMVCIILFSLFEIIASLFSVGKKAFRRIVVFCIINRLVLLTCFILSVTNGAFALAGFWCTLIVYNITPLLHRQINDKLNK